MKPRQITIAVLLAMLVTVPFLVKKSGSGKVRPLPEAGEAMHDIDDLLT